MPSGRAARRGLEAARESIARILHAAPAEVVFTSGGTEANNLAIFGLAEVGNRLGLPFDPSLPPRVVTSPIEHPAVAEAVVRLERLAGSSWTGPPSGPMGGPTRPRWPTRSGPKPGWRP